MTKAKSAEARLPGTEDPEIPEIVAAAAPIIATDSQIEGLKSQLKALKARRAKENTVLLAALKTHLPAGQDYYRVAGIEAWIEHGKEAAQAKEIEDVGDPDTSTD